MGREYTPGAAVAQRALAPRRHKDPGKYPDLVVRVTGFSAYFASLSPALRQFVVDRMLRDGAWKPALPSPAGA
jgi:pyruvate-formate lyase